jgi:hypothetical protein
MAKQEDEAQKKRELREKIQKHVDQLPLWDLFRVYLYIKWVRSREKSSLLAWRWFMCQLKMDEEKAHVKSRLFLRYGGWALFVGGVLAFYILLTVFLQMPYNLWLTFHNLLVVASLLLTAFVGYQHRMFGVPVRFMFLSVTLFFAVIMLLYIGSYVLTTTLLADRMLWIPFFYHDYNYHGFKSVAEYLKHENNYRELFGLQVLSLALSSVMYFAAGSLGYIIYALVSGKRRPAGMAH